VISVDTSVAHLAGAMGRPVWILLPAVPDYRWLLGRSDSPWYPTARLFRQSVPRQWEDVTTSLVEALCGMTGADLTALPDPDSRRLSATMTSTTLSDVPCAAGQRTRIGIDWEIRSDTGWGVYGTYLALALSRRPDVQPMLFAAAESSLHPLHAFELADALGNVIQNRAWSDTSRAAGVMLHGMGNNFQVGPLRDRTRASHRAGVIFFEDTAFEPAAIGLARGLDFIVAGSSWNADVLRSLGLDSVVTCFQGVDTDVFYPAPPSGRLAERFVIFSGGKLEFRKGQDIVVAAFRAFRERHPEALLVTAWHSPWTQLATDLDRAGHVRGAPMVAEGALRIREWLAGNGIPSTSVLDIGRQPNALMGAIVREADVAVFPNRCEGGTNLVAMECMAAGVPTIVSANTGHLDLVAAGATPLKRQSKCPSPRAFFRSTEGWGESDVDELVEALESVWRDRQAARERALGVAATMRDWSWPRQVDRLVTALSPLIS
jgi:glycosyltransferase involved in cell wall biosynthesis